MNDNVAAIVDQWSRERPDLDASPLLVLGRITRLSRCLNTALRAPFAAAGLASGDFDVIAALRRAGEPYTLTPTELSQSMLVTQAAMTKRVDRLSQQGLVQRNNAAHDARSRPVSLTGLGQRTADDLIAQHLANEAAILRALTPKQVSTLADLLSQLLHSIEK